MDYTSVPSLERIEKAIQNIKQRGITVEFVETKEAALVALQAMIPPGATVNYGSSLTLTQIGFEAQLSSADSPWLNYKAMVLAENDAGKRLTLRRQGTLVETFLGSVHAIAETGELVFASATGSQFPAYVYSSGNVIWVAGAQKIVPTLEDAIRRVREYSQPKLDQAARNQGNASGMQIGKLLIFEREEAYLHRKVTLILVNEVLGV